MTERSKSEIARLRRERSDPRGTRGKPPRQNNASMGVPSKSQRRKKIKPPRPPMKPIEPSR